MRSLGLSARLVVTVGVLATVIVIIAAVVNSVLVYVQTERQVRSQLIRTSGRIIQEYLMGVDGRVELQQKDEGRSLVVLLRTMDMSLYLADASGSAIAKYGLYRTIDASTLISLFSIKEKSLHSSVGVYKDMEVSQIGRLDTYTVPMRFGDAPIGVMQLARINYIWPMLWQSLLLALCIQLPLIWIVSAIVIRWGTRATLAPLTQLVKNVENLHVEHLPESLHMPIAMDADVGILTRALQTLITRVRTSLTRQRELAQNLSHEFKTPLARVNARLSLLRPHVTQAQQHIVDDATGEIVRLGQQVDALLDVAIHEASSSAGEASWELSQLFIELIQSISHPERVVLDIPPHFSLSMPIGKARTLWRNILENAVKYSPPESVVEITGIETKEQWNVTVSNVAHSDTSKPENVFVRYYRGMVSKTIGGHGLGMAIVRDICKQLGLQVRYIADPYHVRVEVSGKKTA